MGILATMIMVKMETYMEDDERIMWYMIISAMLFVFSLPFFLVGFHSHTTPVCNCIDKESGTIPSSKSKPNTAVKKVEDALGFGTNKEIDDESSEESESSLSSSILEKAKKKSKSKKKSRKAKSKSKKKRVVPKKKKSKSKKKSRKTNSKKKNVRSGSESSSWSTVVIKDGGSLEEKEVSVFVKKEEPNDTTNVIEKDIFKGSDAEDATTEGDGGEANVEAEIQSGFKKDKVEVEIIDPSDASSSSDEMNLMAGKKEKILKIKMEK